MSPVPTGSPPVTARHLVIEDETAFWVVQTALRHLRNVQAGDLRWDGPSLTAQTRAKVESLMDQLHAQDTTPCGYCRRPAKDHTRDDLARHTDADLEANYA